ncbi:MAG TPA: DUF1570 domain-containing protein, partial [Pirellulaceae bacterium]
MRRFQTKDRIIEGRPVYLGPTQLTVLARDGRLWDLDRSVIPASQVLGDPFRSMSQGEMRAALLAEFGGGFDVSGTGHYLVVHPAGQRDLWAQRFEDLYRQMLRYFAVRRIEVRSPTFPLVAVVFRSQSEFQAHAARQGAQAGGNLLGYYDPDSNRIFLFDVTAGGRDEEDWRENAATIVHEAAHQSAFNIGIHSRFTLPPRWLAEGIGTLFEAPGVYDSSRFGHLHDRINVGQYAAYRRYFANATDSTGVLKSIVAQDQGFGYPQYAISWATLLLFTEQEPEKLSRYLKITAGKSPFVKVPAARRIADFQSAFGPDIDAWETRVHRYL